MLRSPLSNNLFDDKNAGTKIHYMEVCNEISQRTCLSSGKVNKVLQYFNEYLKHKINQGYIINFPDLFYFGYELKKSKYKGYIQIFDDFIDVTKLDNINFDNLINQINLSLRDVKHIIFLYNDLFKQAVFKGYSVSYLHLFHLTNKNNKISVLRTSDIFYSNPGSIIFLVTNGKFNWLQKFNQKEYQISFKFEENLKE